MADVRDSAARFIEAFNAHDEVALRGLNDPNGTFEAPGGVHLPGREATGYAMAWITACPDAKLTVRNQLVSGQWVVEEMTFEGTQDGPLAGPIGNIAPTGRKIVAQSVMFTRFENDLAVETRVYFDQADVLTQLGALPKLAAATL